MYYNTPTLFLEEKLHFKLTCETRIFYLQERFLVFTS
jgi:hypothetical protein